MALFIELTMPQGRDKVYINIDEIVCFNPSERNSGGTHIGLTNGHSQIVGESPQEVRAAIAHATETAALYAEK